MSDTSYDFVIVGSGAGGLAAAIKAKLLGLRPLLLEKTPFIGGSSIMSGGILWLPNNAVMKREGVTDSREAGLRYLENFVAPDSPYSSPSRREAFMDSIEEFIATMEGQGMEYRFCHGYADYYAHLPGGHAIGRALEAELFDLNRLGEWKKRTRMPSFPMPIRTSEVGKLTEMGITLHGKIAMAKFAGRLIWTKLTGQKLSGAGGSLQGRMLEIALKLGVEIWTEAGLVDLDMSNRRVQGVQVNHAGRPITIRATRGVLIAAGGFAHNTAMRQKYQKHPISNAWTFSNPGDTGEAIEAMARAGADLALMDEAWWVMNWKHQSDRQRQTHQGTAVSLGARNSIPEEETPYIEMGRHWQLLPELMKPHTIMVDQAGNRLVNETTSYMEIGRAMYARNATTPAIPSWVVMDIRARKRYFFAMQPPGRIPEKWVKSGWVKVDNTLAGLARQCGIDPSGLEAGVARYNKLCEADVDTDYGRGSNTYHRYYGDPTKANPCMGPISEPPFWAAAVYPGDVGTCGGAIANERAEVIRSDGSVIEGLYAAGNCTASFCGPYYVGAGQSIGASSIFGYIAAKQVAQ
jgi:3-oxosteroid 1-dehydrogenase